ncbi:MAG: hypothetical protein GXP43_02575 [bacterium]|nr:hypothetical protein [bacterium]
MIKTWFHLSPTSIPLAQTEVEEVLLQHKIKITNPILHFSNFIIETDQPIPAVTINRLGGTVWTAEQIDTAHTADAIPRLIQTHFKKLADPSIKKFGIFAYANDHYQPDLSQQLTQQLKQTIKLSYINLKRPRLNSRQLKHTLVFIIVHLKNTFYLLKLTWYYPWEAYMRKDKHKPFVQPAEGMVPHKIARIMVNLSLNQPPNLYLTDQYLLDPFAGSGTILIEALDLGLSVIGIEKHPTSFAGLKQNIDHFISHHNLTNKAILYPGDSTKLNKIIEEKTIIAVATEPYLGPSFRTKTNRAGKQYYVTASQPNTPLTHQAIERMIFNLTKLYSKWLKNQLKILKPKSKTRLVVILPTFHFHNRFYSLNLIDKWGVFDYTLYKGPFTIKSQRDLVIRRQIYILIRK